MLLFLLLTLTLPGEASTIVPRNFGPDGIYLCKCGGQCNPDTGECPGSNQMCRDGSKYGTILKNCQIESLARGKKANQSSVLENQPVHGAPGKAVDGRGYYKGEYPGCSHTSYEEEVCGRQSPVSWWNVDLGEVREISAVWILNLETSHHLANITVRASDKDYDWENAEICYSFSDPPDLWYRQLCDKPLRGQYMRIEKTACTQGTKQPVPYLILCEVLVIDKIYIAASDVAVTSSTVKFSVNEMFYGGVVMYKISLISLGPRGCPRMEKSTTMEGYFSVNQIELTDLSSYWDYEMKIQPVVGTMSYGPSTDFSFTTTGEKPAKAPSGLRSINHYSRSVKLRWDALKCSEWRDGRRNYEVEVLTKFKDTTQKSEAIINTLEPWTLYTARVRSVSSYGESDWETLQFRTKPDKPTSPRNLLVDGYTETSVKLRWTAPEHHHGPPGHYQITIKNVNTSLTESRQTSGISTDITGLAACVDYEFTVKASTEGAGEGPTSNIVKQHTRPPHPPRFETELHIDANEVTLFLPGVKDQRFFVGYIVLVEEQTSVRRRSVSSYCNEASSSAYITANLTHIPATGLNFTVGDNTTTNGVVNRPLSTGIYTIYVAAINRFYSDESYTCTTKDFTTSEVSTVEPQGPSQQGSGGVIGGAIGGALALLAASILIVFVVLRRRRKCGKQQAQENDPRHQNIYENFTNYHFTNNTSCTQTRHQHSQRRPVLPAAYHTQNVELTEATEYNIDLSQQ